jgi:hypothetical protein
MSCNKELKKCEHELKWHRGIDAERHRKRDESHRAIQSEECLSVVQLAENREY